MDRRQITFLFIIAGLVAVFIIVLAVMKAMEQRAAPATLTPAVPVLRTQTATPTPRPTQPLSETRTPITPAQPTLAPETPTPVGPIIPGPTFTPTQPEPTTPSEAARSFFVAPDGDEENDGSRKNPWPLQYALSHPDTVQPGDTIWLIGGTYTGPFEANLEGETNRPITVRALPGERAILQSDDLVLDIQDSEYVNFWGLEITSAPYKRDPNERKRSAYGVRIHQGRHSHHIKFINMLVHDMPAQGFGWWQANSDSEIYGSLIFFNGMTQFDHGIYVHNTEGEKRIVDNFIFDNASHGIHAYGEKEEPELNNLHIEGNTIFSNGSIGFSTKSGIWGVFKRNILVGGYFIAENPTIINNFTYYPGTSGEAINLGYRAGSRHAVVENNYFAGGQVRLGGENEALQMIRNTILGFSLPDLSLRGNELLLFKPGSEQVFIRPNRYEAGRANITVYNWGKKSTLTLTAEQLQDVQIQAGDEYELHNVQDYFGDVITGTYNGRSIEIPMNNHTVAQPIGLDFKPPSSFPEFGAFVLLARPSGEQAVNP